MATIQLEGFGTCYGKALEAELVKVQNEVITLRFYEPDSKGSTDYGFRLKDGLGIGRIHDKDGFRIPEPILEKMKNPAPVNTGNEKGPTVMAAKATAVVTAPRKGAPVIAIGKKAVPVAPKAAGNGNGKTAPKATTAPVAAPTGEVKRRGRPPGYSPKLGRVMTPEEQAAAKAGKLFNKRETPSKVAEKNTGSPKPGGKTAPTVTIGKGKATVIATAKKAPVPTAESGGAKKVGGRPRLAERPTPGKGEAEFIVPEVLFKDLRDRWVKHKGAKQIEDIEGLREALKAAVEVRGFHLILNKQRAASLMALMVLARTGWDVEGVSGSSRRRGAFNLAAKINEVLKVKAPAELRSIEAGKAPAPAPKAPTATPKPTVAPKPQGKAVAAPTGKGKAPAVAVKGKAPAIAVGGKKVAVKK